MNEFLKVMKDPGLVWKFQSLFGVRKLHQIENIKGGIWKAKEIDGGSEEWVKCVVDKGSCNAFQ